MGWLEKMKEMDIMKLRILVFTILVFSFLMALVLLKIGAKRLGLSGGVPPLLKLSEERKEVLIQGGDIDVVNKYLGKRVIIEDRVKEVDAYPDEGLWVVKLTYVSIPLSKAQVAVLKKEGLRPSQLKGMKVRARGILKIHPIYGLQLFLAKNPRLEFVTGKVGR